MALRNGKYNKAVYLPKINFRDNDLAIRYSHHAIEAADSDRYGKIELPDSVNLSRAELVEMEVANGKIYKVVIRLHYNTQFNLVMVILAETHLVKTVWLNKKSDRHFTLRNRQEFVQKPINK